MKTIYQFLFSMLLLCGIQSPSMGQATGQAPTEVITMKEKFTSWDRARIFWPAASIFNYGNRVVLESRKKGDVAWLELGLFPFSEGYYSNYVPQPELPPIILPTRIVAPPPSLIDEPTGGGGGDGNTGGGGVIITRPGEIDWHAYYTHHRLEPDTDYEYRAKVVNAYGEAPYSATLVLRTKPLPPPNPPRKAMARNLIGTRLQLLWTHSLRKPELTTEYVIERRAEGGKWRQVAVVGNDTHSWTDTRAYPGISYKYEIRGQNSAGKSLPRVVNATAHQLKNVFYEPVAGKLSSDWEGWAGVSIISDVEDADKQSIVFSGDDLRALKTSPMVMSKGGILEFEIKDHERASSSAPLVLYGKLVGKEWTEIIDFTPSLSEDGWEHYLIELPPSWSSSGVQFIFIQREHRSRGRDVWFMRNIRVLAITENEPEPPVILPKESLSGTTHQSTTSIKISGKATDAHELHKWAWSLNGGPWKSKRLNSTKEDSWGDIVTGLKPGPNTIKVRASNSAGLQSESKLINVMVR